MGWLASNDEWAIFDCRQGTFRPIEEVPFIVGAGATVDLQVPPEDGVQPEHLEIDVQDNGATTLSSANHLANFMVNGSEATRVNLELATDYLVQLGSTFLVLRGDRKINDWAEKLTPNFWEAIDGNNVRMEAMSVEALSTWANGDPAAWGYWITPAGVESPEAMCPLTHLIKPATPPPEAEELVAEIKDISAAPAELPDKGHILCPSCLQRFEDPYWVATHEDLRPDPVLKGNSFVRFMPGPGDFTVDGNVKDAMGSVCREIACPHCRLILPHGFIQTKNHIVSIVGDARSGKSYYLSVLVKQLPEILLRRFKVNFTDLNPEGNIPIHQMSNTLFSRTGPDQARLLKTTLDGHMYQDIHRKGRVIKMPQPFIFSIDAPVQSSEDHSVTFYDNAGEHFQPGMDSEDRPGAQHVGNATGILFVFDPFNSIEFRRRLSGCKDPQMESEVTDLHRTMLDEIGARIRKKRNLPPNEKINEHIAFIVGKYDAWMNCFPSVVFDEPTEKPFYSCHLSHGDWDIGREIDSNVGVRIPLDSISRVHARLKLEPDRIEITDLDSRNGTYVDGARIVPNTPTLIRPMSKIRLHKYPLRLEEIEVTEQAPYPYRLSCLEETPMFDMEIVESNSSHMREILMEVCPAVVASAERISHNVRYFPSSTFGHTPVKLEDGIAPDPNRLVPFLVTTPVLWILSHAATNFIPLNAPITPQPTTHTL